jgi:hypothetical protein
MTTAPDFEVSATEVAVTVMDWLALVAAGGVRIAVLMLSFACGKAEAVVSLDSVPAEVCHVTPLASFITMAVNVMEFFPVPSTEATGDLTLTPMVNAPPPQPLRARIEKIPSEETPRRGRTFRNMANLDHLFSLIWVALARGAPLVKLEVWNSGIMKNPHREL